MCHNTQIEHETTVFASEKKGKYDTFFLVITENSLKKKYFPPACSVTHLIAELVPQMMIPSRLCES